MAKGGLNLSKALEDEQGSVGRYMIVDPGVTQHKPGNGDDHAGTH